MITRDDLNLALNNRNDYNRFVKSVGDLVVLGRQFPGHDNILGQDSVQKALNVVRMQTKEAKAYTKGATIGALSGGEFSQVLNSDVSIHIGSFLNRKDGAKLAETRQDAFREAKDAESEEKNRKNKPGGSK